MKKYINLFFIGVILLSTWACNKTRLIYDGPLQLEFKNIYLEIQSLLGASNMGSFGIFTSTNVNLNSLGVRRSVIGCDSIRVQLIGPQQSQPITVNYTINSNSTAIAGTHYSIVESIRLIDNDSRVSKNVIYGNTIAGGSLVIPANSSVGYIYLQIPTTGPSLPPTGVDLIINMTGGTLGDGKAVKAAANYSTFTYNIRP